MKSERNPSNVADQVQLGRDLPSGGVQEERFFDVHGVRTRVVANSGAVAGAVSKLLRSFEIEKAAATDIEVHLFAVDALSDDMAPVPPQAPLLYDWGMVKVFHSGPFRHLRVDDRARVVADIENMAAVGFARKDLLQSDWLISNLFFYPLWGQLIKEAGLFPLHAAGLARDGRGFLFLGKSGSGKSTLTLNLVRTGYGLLSDDTVFLRMSGGKVEALSFPEEINVNEQTVELLPELSAVKNFTMNELRQKSSFSIEELYPGCVVESAVPDVLVFPQVTDAEITVVRPMSRTEALAVSMRYGYFFMDPSTTGRHFEIMSQLARQTDCYRLFSGRNQEELERTVSDLLEGSTEKDDDKA